MIELERGAGACVSAFGQQFGSQLDEVFFIAAVAVQHDDKVAFTLFFGAQFK